jgi:hypothetical protein
LGSTVARVPVANRGHLTFEGHHQSAANAANNAKPNMGIRGSSAARREILRSLTKKQESFSTVLAHRMKSLETKAFAFFIVTRTAMPYDGIRKCGEEEPLSGDKISFHAIH